ncbi:glycosyltransferase family 2 protein [Hahella aquimaris]|uniref:glycosyltransferase family 2 protein n=1 Tax=Hahella sp. HNIBRBA332 TaxID=3015983 RepID=UPI00273BEA4D|nr:glycosyltransferase family 2 protein [Hahella sp. HNIBRBA332]WLQ16653.1 glycosyltransferase family 2 protein [Hahella sp. HNIBRBA332]
MTDLLLWSCTLILGLIIVYHHIGYPVLLRYWANRKRQQSLPRHQEDAHSDYPELSIIIPVYNEAEVIAEKLRNLAFLDYPAHRFEVRIYDDGSQDDTLSIIHRTLQEADVRKLRVQVIANETNQGKVAVINQAMGETSTELVLLSDASALISIDALKIIARHMRDASVGVVAASYQILTPGSEGEETYWRYQTKIKEMESVVGSTIGAHGALYCFRRSLFETLPENAINDDFILPMRIVAQGRRCIYDRDIVAVELEQASLTMDHQRRKRIAAGNVQQALMLMPLLNPKHGATAFNYISGKFLRVCMPLILMAFLLCTLLLSLHSWLAMALLVGQILVYGLASIRALTPGVPWPKPVNLVHYLVSGHFANALGALRYLSGQENGRWQRVKLEVHHD